MNPHIYHVSLSRASHELKQSLIAEMTASRATFRVD